MGKSRDWKSTTEKYCDTEKIGNILAPCPFCGKNEAKCHKENEASFIVECGFCMAASRRMWSRYRATREWNKRAQ